MSPGSRVVTDRSGRYLQKIGQLCFLHAVPETFGNDGLARLRKVAPFGFEQFSKLPEGSHHAKGLLRGPAERLFVEHDFPLADHQRASCV